MKKIVIAMMSSAVLASCTNGAVEQQSSTVEEVTEAQTLPAEVAQVEAVAQVETNDVETLEKRVSYIYGKIVDFYNEASKDPYSFHGRDFDGEFCSDAWNQTMRELNEKDSQNEGEIGFLDYDYWCRGQDFADMRVENIKVLDNTDKEAKVSLDLYNMGKKFTLTLDMVFERGDWYINDMSDERSLMNDVREYIAM